MAIVLRRRALQVINKKILIFPISYRENSTEKNILKSVYEDIEKPRQTVTEFVWQNLDKWPDKTLTVCAVTGRGYTYAQTHRISVAFASSLLKKLKLQNDDKVAIVLPNVPEYPAIALGILEAGCVASMMNPAYTVDELKYQIQLVECKAVVSSKLSYPNIYKALQELKINIPVILIDNEDLPENTIKFAEFAESNDLDILKSVKRSVKDTAILPFSSGTTGFPKAVELTHGSIAAVNSMILNERILAVQEATASFQPVLPVVLPLFHIFGFNVLMLNLMSRGVKLVTMPVFKPELYLETLIRQKANHLYVVPPMAVFLGKHPAVTSRHLDSVIDIICGAASISSSDAMTIIEKKKNLIFRQGYGLTETNGGATIGYNNNTNHDSVGFTFGSSEIKIADLKTQKALGPGEEGEIWYRGANVMKGYYKNEAATKEVLTEDGWFKTGDIGKYDENKYVYITDRLKELIKECAVTKKKYTYKQVIKNMAIFATSLRKKLGLNPDDVVVSLLPNMPEYPIVALGTIQAGCIFSSINPMYKEAEINHQVSITEPKVIVTIPECYDTVVKGLKMAKSQAKIVLIDNPNNPVPEGTIRYSEIAENGEADYSLIDGVNKNLEDVAFIPFSSGTTGLPKGVEITYKNLIAGLEMMNKDENCFPVLTNGPQQDVVPCILPFFHIYGMVVTLLGHFVKGCKLITLPKFSPNIYFDVLKNQNPTILYVVPPIAILLGKHPEVTKDHLKHIKYMVCGAAPLSASDANSVLEKGNSKLEFKQGYGATETTSLTTSTFKGVPDIDYSSCGMPLANTEIMFLGSDGKPVPVGESGELCTRSPTTMKGYYKNEKATKDCMTEDGFFKTGDLGYYDPKYGLYVTDRIKELIKVKGMQVAPAELESLLRSHPSVADAAVIGVPHEYFGETPKAFIIKKSGANTSPEELQDFVANKVASFKRIDEVVFVNDIPKTTSGKILRKELKKMYV